ncbi:hypothetical protein AAMO2058_001339900 [Amorphochlora amoebiformis]|eukprot:1393608-Amorphochlora_amoeboformis.AAC.1
MDIISSILNQKSAIANINFAAILGGRFPDKSAHHDEAVPDPHFRDHVDGQSKDFWLSRTSDSDRGKKLAILHAYGPDQEIELAPPFNLRLLLLSMSDELRTAILID